MPPSPIDMRSDWDGKSELRTAFTLTSRYRPPLYTRSDTVLPGATFCTSRMKRLARADIALMSSTSSRGTRTSTPFTAAMRSPSTTPAFSAGPFSTTEFTKSPSVSRTVPDPPIDSPIMPRFSSSIIPREEPRDATRVRVFPSSSAAETVFTFTVRDEPPLCTRSSTSSPAFALANVRVSRRCASEPSVGSAASSALTRRLTPFTAVITSPALSPALAAGPLTSTASMRTPSVSFRSLEASVTPSAARLLEPKAIDIAPGKRSMRTSGSRSPRLCAARTAGTTAGTVRENRDAVITARYRIGRMCWSRKLR